MAQSIMTSDSDASPLLEVRELCKSFAVRKSFFRRSERFQALDQVSFVLHAGETVGLIGESGSGKSTAARIIAKLMHADSGQVLLEGDEILRVSARQFASRRRQIQMIFQNPNSSMNPRLTMEQTLSEPLLGFNLGDVATRRARIREMLPVVGLDEDILNRYPHQLSGGQKQRVAILGVLLVEPKLVIADEIVSALDLSVQAQILNLWRDLQAKFQLATLFISHDLQVVGWLADRILVMLHGQIVEAGLTEEICQTPKHPYTQLLFAAHDVDLDERHAVASHAEETVPLGCPFYARCPLRQDLCRRQQPVTRALSVTHSVRCHMLDE